MMFPSSAKRKRRPETELMLSQDDLLQGAVGNFLDESYQASAGFESFESLFGLDPFVLSPFTDTPVQQPQPLVSRHIEPLVDTVYDFLDLSVHQQPVGQSVDLSISRPSSAIPQVSQEKVQRAVPSLAVASSICPEDESLLSKREKNRLAAERCRQRKANLIESLQVECDQLRLEREKLLAENARLLQALGVIL